jgi:hypothetical protein
MSSLSQSRVRRFTSCLAGFLAGIALAGVARAETPFLSLSGTWSGGGQVKFSGGNAESLRCRAYYTPKDTGQSLGLSIRCASQSNKIELRANLNYEGGKVTGSWEERTFNAAGKVTGQASVGKISLSINGGGFNGSMSVGTTGSQQTVVIQTDGIGLQSVNINLSRG